MSELPNIVKIEANWYHGYANSPQLDITVDHGMPKFDEWIYQATSDPTVDPVMLVSKNFDPWVRFVYIADRTGNPSLEGALGGTYHLDDDTTLESRTGWSSRAGVINKNFSDYIPGEILEPGLNQQDSGFRWAGYAITADYIKQHELWPEDLYLIRNVSDSGEITHTPSIDPDEVVKP